MPYRVKSIQYTVQGEGVHAGRPAVFLRFSGCNLWSGSEETRQNAICRFCDTDFVGTNGPGGGVFPEPADLARDVLEHWPSTTPRGATPFVVCTGGEPLLQLDVELVQALKNSGFEVAVETNGTRPIPPDIDWVSVSPKAGATAVVGQGNELKLVFPQPLLPPEAVSDLRFDHFFLQPMDGPELAKNTREALSYCLLHPKWRISVQLHKVLGVV